MFTRAAPYTATAAWAAGPGASAISTTAAGRATNAANWWIRPRYRGFGGSGAAVVVRFNSDREVGDPPPGQADQGVHRAAAFGLRSAGGALCHRLHHTHQREGHRVGVTPLDVPPGLPHDEVPDLPDDA